MKLLVALLCFSILCVAALGQIVQFSGAPLVAACSTGVLDTFAASPGAWTATYSHRKLRAAYNGNAIQIQRSSDSTTLDVGFSGCNPNTSPTTSFCATQTLAAGTTSSARVAYPSGTVVHVFNGGPNLVFYASGNSSVTATTASTALNFRQGVNITVGADTNIAAIIGTGFGTDGGAGSASLFLTNCGVSKVYDQSGNSNDLTPVVAGLVNQMGYVPTGQGSLPLLFGCLSNCGLKAADSASYKTSTINTFSVLSFGEDIVTANFNYNSVGYPTTTTSASQDFRWGMVNAGLADVLVNNINGNNLNNNEGFGGVFRGQNITQYDYSTNGITRWNGGTQFLNAGSGTPTYPNAVGLYVMADAAGNGTPGTWAETLVASGTQTARDTISANQVSYWGITTGAAATSARSNPLGDGFNWNQLNLGSFGGSPKQSYTVNGNVYNSEASWNDYNQWQCSNCSTSGGRLGDVWRYQVTLSDVWDGTNRSELDGFGGAAQFGQNVNIWLSYAVWVEPGTSYTASWNITGQFHTIAGPICCVFNINYKNDTWIVNSDSSAGGGTETIQYTSPTTTRGVWYHFVFQIFMSSGGSSDVMKTWCDCVTPGTMAQVVNASGSLFGGAANTGGYWKYGIYRETAAIKPTFAIRYGNMQICSSGSDCTSKYGVTDLSALAVTPLADPAHN